MRIALANVAARPIHALVALVAMSSPLASALGQEAQPKPSEKFEFFGYWRVGLNTSLNPLLEAPDAHGKAVAPVSRHTRDPNYFNLGLRREFENGMKVQFKADNVGFLQHNILADEDRTATAKRNEVLNIRDLFVELPLDGGASLWAGSRDISFEDLRILDVVNPFNLSAFGVGGTFANTFVALSVAGDKVKPVWADAANQLQVPQPEEKVAVKRVQFLARHSIDLGGGFMLHPMLLTNTTGVAEQDKVSDTSVRRRVEGATGVKVGGTLGRTHPTRKNTWGNTTLWLSVEPVDPATSKNGYSQAYGLSDSASYDYDVAGLLTGVHLEVKNSKQEQQVLKVAKGQLVADGAKKTRSTVGVSVAVQPVYYVTDRFHAALDLNYATKNKKVDAKSDADAMLVTPILRYAMNRNVLGTPQIYTSVTYGKYDWKAKKMANGEASDTLITTQTGFEVWF